jgi:GH15 family glucan-1,4-alpha-glucosidase
VEGYGPPVSVAPSMDEIADHAFLGDCHSCALVTRDASIDWACFPRFDAPSVFARVLDADCGGSFDAVLDGLEATSRAYVEDTNVLVTTLRAPDGDLEVTDCMPVRTGDHGSPVPQHALLRRLVCTRGTVTVTVRCSPRPEYGAVIPRHRLTSLQTAEVVGGADAIHVTATRALEVDDASVHATWTLAAGETAWVEAAWTPSSSPRQPADAPSQQTLARQLEETIAFWQGWLAGCRYDGDHESEVRRSALVLKALTYAPSGAVIAAATTSLPEQLGGERNWDYRYTWIRDGTLTLISLFVLGFDTEATAFKTWLERTGAGRPQDLQIMYGICGERTLPEIELDHLAGHRGSRPVRIGNGAVKQMQLDCYGQLLEAAWLYRLAGGEITEDNWHFLAGVADIVVDRWRLPDQGIWEIRDDPRHFVHSKLNCWVALDRAVKLAASADLPGDVDRWATERDLLRAYLLEEGAEHGWFPQAVGNHTADASALLVPALGFLPSTSPQVLQTVDVVRRDLSDPSGLVHRYLAPDGLAGGEGAFLLCSFWLLDVLIHAGRLDEADSLLTTLLSHANDVGLYAEEIDPRSGIALGNMPQAFTHMALVTSCASLSAARRGLLPPGDEVSDYAEVLLRLLLDRRDQPPDPQASGSALPHLGTATRNRTSRTNTRTDL